MENSTTSKIIIASFLALLAMCLIWAITAQQSKRSLQRRLVEEQRRSETLHAEVRNALIGSRDSSKMFEKQKAELRELLEHKSASLTTRTLENKKIEKALRIAEQQHRSASDSSNQLREKLDRQLSSNSALTTRGNSMSDSISLLRNEIAYLKSELDEAIMRSIDQTLVSALKRNNSKVTSKARATKKLVARVEVPASVDDLRFIVEGPEGKAISESSGSISARMLDDDENAVASARDKVYLQKESQSIEITYVPDQRLKAGTYTFKIFNGEKYVGSMMVNLR